MAMLIFFTFLAAIILVPQILIYNDRRRLHETLRIAFERGQPVPPQLIMALQPRGRGFRYDPYFNDPSIWRTAAPPPTAEASTATPMAEAEPLAAAAPLAPAFLSADRRDLRRGLIWLGVGLGLLAAGVASYAGLYNVGGAQETLSLFAAFGSIPGFIGLTYLGLWWFESRKTKV